MKKTILFSAAGLALLSLAACSGNCQKGGCQKDGLCVKSDIDQVYTGILPAADCDGVRYTLTLDYDDDGNDGDYKLIETYLKADTAVVTGYSDIKSFVSEGDFRVERKGDKTYLKLVKDRDDSQIGSVDTPIYFVVDTDSTITMTDSNLQVATSGLNYTLKK
ncbi:MAG: copper resistance protein NlpE [Muribaculaceae bacterium]|nr:copper resistance protein NlpE [Muribaculaceae bacterium]